MCSRPGKAGREVEIMKTVENPGQMSSNTVGWMKLGVSASSRQICKVVNFHNHGEQFSINFPAGLFYRLIHTVIL